MIDEKNKARLNDMLIDLSEAENKLNENSSRLSVMRFISFFAGAILLVVGLKDGVPGAAFAGILLAVLFIVLVCLHEKISGRLTITSCKKKVVERYIHRFDNSWREFEDTGEEFIDKEDWLTKDLDLIGKDSLYQLINVCHTYAGRSLLAHKLCDDGDYDVDGSIKEACAELVNDIDGAILFEAYGLKNEKNVRKVKTDRFKEFCKKEDGVTIPIWARFISIVLPVMQILCIVLWIMGMVTYVPFIALFLIMLGFGELTRGITESITAPVSQISLVTSDYTDMLEVINRREYSSKKLSMVKEKISGNEGTLVAFKKLGVLSNMYNLSFNPVVYQVLNGVFLWNYRLAALALRWKKKYGAQAGVCMDIIAMVEYLRSLSVLAIVRKTGWADINFDGSKDNGIECRNLYHPLLVPDEVVDNSVSLDAGITIITGSNMSGKTTFLRTLAVNLLLGYLGAPVCGEKLDANCMKIFTSMRVTDDVANGISTFYAEILRIKKMAEYRETGLPMICFIDEIFKGTNSADRIIGATEAIKQLSSGDSIVIVSTHDFELCKIDDVDGRITDNFHFEEYYEDDAIKFDYKIKDGPCNTTNAKALLKMAGFNV